MSAGRMGGPLWYLGLWSQTADGKELLDRTVAAFRTIGAPLRERREGAEGPVATLRSERMPTHPPGGVDVSILPASDGTLVQAVLSGAVLDALPPLDRRPLVAALAEVVLAVRPALATLSVEEPPDHLPFPGEDEWWSLFTAGWVDLDACAPRQRAAFERLRDSGRALPVGPGIWWGVSADLFPQPAPGQPSRDIAERAYRAWAGERPRPAAPHDVEAATPPPHEIRAATPPPHDADDVHEADDTHHDVGDPTATSARPQLWFWSSDADPDALAARVVQWLGDDGYEVAVGGEDDPAWRPVTATPPPGTAEADLLAALRVVAGEVGCSWAGLQPGGWFAVPGLDPQLPETGLVVHPWVDRAWIGDLLPELEAALPGAVREVFGGGVLLITSPALAPVTDPGWRDVEVRFTRWTAAAGVLARVARRSVGHSPGADR